MESSTSQLPRLPPTQPPTLFERLDQLNEFEREPVTEDRLESRRHFAAVFAGEHVAGTEFVIGALFVSWGVGTRELILGLLLGNLLAVLSWTFICAPIAVETRLTLYWYLRRIAGPAVTTIYNLVNGILFCAVAGAMITVSASAVRIPFGIPPQTQWYPTDLRFVLVAVAVGSVVVTIAILGFRRLAQFSTICVPWIFVIFFAGALAVLPQLTASLPEVSSIRGLDDLWRLAEERVWIGRQDSGFSLWHVAGFAWMCNLAFHVGLSDMALLRYAPRASYGLFSACGMYMGHFMVWIASGVMGAGAALLLKTSLSSLDSGEVAHQALGLGGALCVIVSGWATSNPTLYRAGLAFQVITPEWPRWLVTLLAGAATVTIACFPFIFRYLLEFAGVFAILMAPIAGVVFVEHWIFPRIGLRRFWFSHSRGMVNWPALVAWAVAVLVCFTLWRSEFLHVVFLPVPGWLLTAILYTVLAALAGARREGSREVHPSAPEAVSRPAVAASAAPDRVARSSRSAVQIVSGVIGVLSLAVCLGLALWVGLMGEEGYDLRLATFKNYLAVASLVHLTAAAIWVLRSEQTEAT